MAGKAARLIRKRSRFRASSPLTTVVYTSGSNVQGASLALLCTTAAVTCLMSPTTHRWAEQETLVDIVQDRSRREVQNTFKVKEH